MINFAVDIQGGEQLQRAILSMSELCQRPMVQPGVFDGLLSTYKSHTGKVFATRGAVLGTPWPPLAPSTIAARLSSKGGRGKARRSAARRLAGSHGMDMLILRDTLKLEQSLINDARRDFGKKKTHQKVEFWTRVKYAKYHQTGTQAHGMRTRLSDRKHLHATGGMPARPLYIMTQQFGSDFNAVMRESLHDFMRSRVNGGI